MRHCAGHTAGFVQGALRALCSPRLPGCAPGRSHTPALALATASRICTSACAPNPITLTLTLTLAQVLRTSLGLAAAFSGAKRPVWLGRRGGGRLWAAGSAAGARLYGFADGARKSIPSKCMGCMPAKIGVCARAANGAQGSWPGARRGHKARGRAQQVCAAGAQQARAVPWAGREHTGARGARTWRFERVSGRLNAAFIQSVRSPSNPPKSPVSRAPVCFPSCPRHSARLLRACRTHLLRAPQPTVARGAHLASVPGSLHRMHMRTARRHAEQAHALGRDAPIRASSATP